MINWPEVMRGMECLLIAPKNWTGQIFIAEKEGCSEWNGLSEFGQGAEGIYRHIGKACIHTSCPTGLHFVCKISEVYNTGKNKHEQITKRQHVWK